MWENPCVALTESNMFGVWAAFSMDACCIFLQCVLAIFSLVEGVTGVVMRACTGY